MSRVYLQRTGRGDVREVNGGLFLYVWGADGIKRAMRDALDEIEAIRPAAIILHDSPSALARDLGESFMLARRVSYKPRIMVGVGMDGTVEQWRRGEVNAERVLAPLRHVAELCTAVNGVECIVWNGESRWKDTDTDKVSMQEIEQLARTLGEQVTRAAPDCVHWLSSFDQPTLHGALRGFLRGFAPYMSAYTGQAYVVVPGGAPPGALARRIAAAERSQELAERAGMLPDDLVELDTAFDCDRIPTFQGYGTPLPDLLKAAAERDCAVWSSPMLKEGGRLDAIGLVALAFAQRARDAGLSVIEYQRALGVTPDGKVGPVTLRAALGEPFLRRVGYPL